MSALPGRYAFALRPHRAWGPLSRAASWAVVAVLVAALAFPLLTAPALAQPESPLVVIGDHQMTVLRTSLEGATSVTERIHLSNEAATDYDGEVWADLHPAATQITHSIDNPDGTPRGLSGQVRADPLPTETVGDHVRHTIDLAARNVTIVPDDTVVLRLNYILPPEVEGFTRGFTLDTPRLAVFVGQVQGLLPVSEDTPLESMGANWMFTLAPGAEGPFAVGDRFAFTWEEHPVPMVPLSVHVAAAGSDPMILTATASGGIPPYTYGWDLTGDGDCDDAEGPSVELDAASTGTHQATVCVTDGAVPTGEVMQTYETRTMLVEGAWEGPSPWLLLVIGLVVGALLLFALSRSGAVPVAGAREGGARRDGGPSFGAESRDVLETRQRVMVAALKELEIARKKGEVSEGVYTPLKAELKKDTVRVMRELERRKEETI